MQWLLIKDAKKYGSLFAFIEEKCKRWAKYLEIADFKRSPGCISSVLKRHNIERISLHGEADDMTAEEFERVTAPRRKHLEDIYDKKNISPCCL